MNDSPAWKLPVVCTDDGAHCCKPFLDTTLTAGGPGEHACPLDPNLPPFGDSVRGDAVDTVCPLTADASVRGTAQACSTIDPAQPTNVKAAEGLDPAFAAPVTATPEEIRHAHELRLQLEKKYLNRPRTSCFPWCVDVD